MPSLNIKGFPDELYQILRERAKKDRPSLSGEVIYLLEFALEATEREKSSLLQLRGLGKKQLKGLDASKHIAQERESWES